MHEVGSYYKENQERSLYIRFLSRVQIASYHLSYVLFSGRSLKTLFLDFLVFKILDKGLMDFESDGVV